MDAIHIQGCMMNRELAATSLLAGLWTSSALAIALMSGTEYALLQPQLMAQLAVTIALFYFALNRLYADNPDAGCVGGVLVLLGIQLWISPALAIIDAYGYCQYLFVQGGWSAMTTPGADFYHPYWSGFISLQLGVQLFWLMADLLLLVLFFRCSARFPRLYSLALLLMLANGLAFSGGLSLIYPDEPWLILQQWPEFIAMLIKAIIWIPYLLLARRSRATFVRRPEAGGPAAVALA